MSLPENAPSDRTPRPPSPPIAVPVAKILNLKPSAPAPANASSAPPTPPPPVTQKREPLLHLRFDNWESVLTGKRFLICLGSLSVLLVLWSLFWELPKASESQIVAARTEMEDLQKNLFDASAYRAVDPVGLSNQLAKAQSFLIPSKEEMVSLVTTMEHVANTNAWKAEITIRGVSESLSPDPSIAVYPAVLKLTAAPDGSEKTTPFSRLMTFLEAFDALPQKVEIVGLSVLSEHDTSVSTAILELQFWTRKSNEKPAAK